MNPGTTPIKICFISPKAYPLFNPDVKKLFGGAEVDLYLLSTELVKDENFKVSFITADYGQDEIEMIEGVRIIKSLDFSKNSLTGAIKIWQALRKADADIYMMETISLGVFLVALFCKINKKTFLYRTSHTVACDGTYLKRHPILGRIFNWAWGTARIVFVQNESDRENLKRTTGATSIVMPNAHRLPLLTENNRDIILWVGRSVKFKRPELFVKLAETCPQQNFVMVCQHATGDKDYDQLVNRARSLKNLEFIERVPFNEVDNYFKQAKVFICTSEGEGFPNTYVQACKNGTPILSLAVNPDDFINKYNCGLCANDNWDLFVQNLREVIDTDKFKELGPNARKYAENKHDIKKVGDEYKKLFHSLIKND
jgi:glycosyltransferase involved in cell wall biosynthesis